MTMEGGNAVRGTGLAGAIARARKRAYPNGYVASKDPLVNLESKEIADYIEGNITPTNLSVISNVQELSFDQSLNSNLSYSGHVMTGNVLSNSGGILTPLAINTDGKFVSPSFSGELPDITCRGVGGGGWGWVS